MLRQHGEDDLTERALSVSDDELARIGTLGAYYAWSEDAIELGGSMGGARALSLASIDVLENTGRDLRLSHTEGERRGGSFDRFAERDRVMDRELRRHAAERQIPADKSKRTLDVVDPRHGVLHRRRSAAERAVLRVAHQASTGLHDRDLSIMIGQQVALNHLVWPALDHLRSDSPIDDNDYPANLLASLLRVNTAYWERTQTTTKNCSTWLRVHANGSSSPLNCASSSKRSTETIQLGALPYGPA